MLLLSTTLLALLAAQEGAPVEAGAAPEKAEDVPAERPVGPRVPETWRIFEPKRGDTLASIRAGDDPIVLEGAFVQASPRTALILYQGGGPFRGTVIRDSILKVVPGTIPEDRSFWGVRGYDMIDTLFERVEIAGFGRVTSQHDEGHAMYLNLAGSFTLLDSLIRNNGGQGLQIVNRPTESNLPRGAAKGAITVKNCRFQENGFNPDRGGFQISIFGTGQAIVMEDVEITAGLAGMPFPGDRTGGALLIEAEGFDPHRPLHAPWWRPPVLPEDFVMPFSQGRTELTRLKLHHVRPNKPLVQIKGCEELVVRDCEFTGGRIELDHPQKAGRDCGRIVWEGNRGDANVYVRGRFKGPANQDFVIE